MPSPTSAAATTSAAAAAASEKAAKAELAFSLFASSAIIAVFCAFGLTFGLLATKATEAGILVIRSSLCCRRGGAAHEDLDVCRWVNRAEAVREPEGRVSLEHSSVCFGPTARVGTVTGHTVSDCR